MTNKTIEKIRKSNSRINDQNDPKVQEFFSHREKIIIFIVLMSSGLSQAKISQVYFRLFI